MANNSLSGSVSSLLCHPMNKNSQLRYLDLSQNLLSEELPDCFTNWKFLVYVNLGSNNLKGSIPESVGSLSNLQSLHLPKNQFSGDLPLSLQNCRSLRLLDVGENNFSRFVPSCMNQNIRALKLRSNQFTGNIPSEICQLSSLMILDLANNKFSGSIPRCIHNITSMIFPNASIEHEFNIVSSKSKYVSDYSDTLMLLMKGQELSYSSNLELVHMIDLSRNNLSGVLPPELFALTSLQSLNLSQNHLVGKMPEEIRDMKLLESLDVSKNKLSGPIPESLSILSFLSHLNLSFNNFTSKIPTGTQLQSFDALSYIGEKLDKKEQHGEEDDFEEFLFGFYASMGVGFAVGFWVVCATIFFNRRCRHGYFKFVDHVKDKLYVFIVLKMKSLR
ncbi:receptor-like protein EIX2 [Prosopis cineraria]|uniref:receptor-like protein EIX2 n=1 Tax=Prosopis cineraria TaxID=364024 RepID=UPI0024106286|nr:receptor-like protein EIX2 [Prosopis cineraria]